MREEVPIESLLKRMEKENARLVQIGATPLRLEEVVAARLYTGPLFIKYNAVLRGSLPGSPAFAASAFDRLCMGNRYTTTVSDSA